MTTNEAIQTLEKSLEKTPPPNKKKQKVGEDDFSNGGASNVDGDGAAAVKSGKDAKKKNDGGGEDPEMQFKRDFFEKQWRKDARIYEYGSAANPDMKPIPVLVHPPDWHARRQT